MKRIDSLKGKRNFREIYTEGNRFRHRGIQLIILELGKREKNRDAEVCIQVGIPIKKRYGNAVARNRARRRIRAVCRELLRETNVGYMMILQPGEEFKNLSYKDSKEIIKLLFNRAGVLKSI